MLCSEKRSRLQQLKESAPAMAGLIGEIDMEWQRLQSQSHLPDSADFLHVAHITQRLEMYCMSGHGHDRALWEYLASVTPPAWQADSREHFTFPKSGVSKDKIAAHLLKSIEAKPQEHVEVRADAFAKEVVETLTDQFFRQNIAVECRVSDTEFTDLLMHHSSDAQLTKLVDWYRDRDLWTDKIIALRTTAEPSKILTPAQETQRLERWKAASDSFFAAEGKRRQDFNHPNYQPWILTYLPTRYEAALDQMEYEPYKTLYLEACDQPWEAIEQAQAKLIQALDAGKEMHITNSDGTDLRFSIEGHSFANSMVRRNLPGSEMFSAPVKTSVNGRIVAKGGHKIVGQKEVVRDITYDIVDGRITEWQATENKDALDTIITKTDRLPSNDPQFEANRYFGEIGFGTNPQLRQSMVNGFLTEKISGSFHMAIGDSYNNGYLGNPNVKLDNGNKAPGGFHWDITTMLRGKDGEIWLDGHLLQKDGEWLAVPALGIAQEDVAVLNNGWDALRDAGKPIPAYWEKALTNPARVQQR
ncbi:MAG: hypothetical protein CMM93_02265 [Rickettsiales bacterium]|nr:hypothetical protein [Rickettsiales bacterium]